MNGMLFYKAIRMMDTFIHSVQEKALDKSERECRDYSKNSSGQFSVFY